MTKTFRIVVGSIIAAMFAIVMFMFATLFREANVDDNKHIVHPNWEYQLIIDTSDVMVYQGYRLVGRVKYSDIGKLDSLLRTDSKEISSLIKPRK